VRRHDHDRDVGVAFADAVQELVAVHARHSQVGEDDVGRFLRHEAQRLLAVRRQEDLVAVVRQDLAEALARRLFIVDDQDSSLRRAHPSPPCAGAAGALIGPSTRS
jgi:hypothetical protein